MTKQCHACFLGYVDQEYGYRLWDTRKKTMIRNKNVMLYEKEILSQDDSNGEDNKEIPIEENNDDDSVPSPVQGMSV